MSTPQQNRTTTNVVPLHRERVSPSPNCEECGKPGHDYQDHCDICGRVHPRQECEAREEAERRQARLIADAIAEKVPSPVAIPAATSRAVEYTTKALLDAYHAERKARTRATGTLDFIAKHSRTLLRLLPAQARDITHEVLQGYITTRREEGAGEIVRKEIHGVLRPAIKLAYKNERFERDPAKVIPEIDSLSKPRERALAPEEVWGLCLYFVDQPRLRIRAAHVAYAVAVGGDPAAMPRALRADVREDYRGARVHGTKNDRRDRLAVTPMPLQRAMLRFALAEVDAHRTRKTRSKRKPGEAMFPPWANAVRDLKLACEALGIARCSPTDFRRTYATWMGQCAIRDELIQRCMGQAPTSVLDKHYRKLTDDDLIGLVEEEYARHIANRA